MGGVEGLLFNFNTTSGGNTFTHLLKTLYFTFFFAVLTKGHDTSVLSCVKRVVKERGVLGLYRGMSLNFVKATPAVCVTYITYENAKAWLDIAS